MKLLLGNRSLNYKINKQEAYSKLATKGDNKKNLWTLPKDQLKEYNYQYKNEEDIKSFDDIKTYKIIILFRCNRFIKTYYNEIKISDIKFILYLDDLHNSPEIQELKNLDNNFPNSFNLILSTYQYTFNKFFNNITTKIYWFPHSFNELFYNKLFYNNKPKNELLLSGCLSPNIYPMRNKLKEYCSNYPISILKHPGYNTKHKHKIVSIRYYQYLQQYRFAFTCCSNKNLPYLLAKFFEIPACGVVLLAYDRYIKKELKQLGFEDNKNYISITEDNLEYKLNYIFDKTNENEIELIRKNGYEFIKNNHTLKIRIQKLMLDLDL